MKNLSIFVLLIFFFSAVGAQEAVVTWDGLKKQKEKNDSDITNSKKNTKSKTWLKRSDIYLNIHTFVIGGLYQGLQAKPTDDNMFNTVERLFGKPGKVMTNEDEEIWVYNRKKLIIKNGVLDSWEQTEFIDKDALSKSAEALIKAIDIDESGSLKDKSTTKDKVQILKSTVINKAISEYTAYNKDFTKNNKLTEVGIVKLDVAYDLMSLGFDLCKLPKNKADTIFNIDQVEYFKGVISFNNNKYDIAKPNFESSISKKYGEGGPYHYLAECYANTGDSSKYISIVKQGFENYPEEEQLIIDLINYYMVRNEENKAIEYIDLAIVNNPKNHSYYSAKATIYDNRTDTLLSQYNLHMDNAYELKKEAFRERNNNPKKSDEIKLKRDAEVTKALEIIKEIESNLDEAVNLYNSALEINPKFYNASYNIGRILLKHNERNAKHADYILKIYFNKDFTKSEKYENLAKQNLKSAALKFEEAYKINSNDRDVLEVLKRIYYRLHDTENKERIEGLLKNMSEEKIEEIK